MVFTRHEDVVLLISFIIICHKMKFSRVGILFLRNIKGNYDCDIWENVGVSDENVSY